MMVAPDLINMTIDNMQKGLGSKKVVNNSMPDLHLSDIHYSSIDESEKVNVNSSSIVTINP